MKYVIALLLILFVSISSIMSSYAQQPELATYRETAHVLVDDVSQNQTSAFITLSTVSNLEMRVPTEVDNAIHDAQNITSVRITNAPGCALGTPTYYVGNKTVTTTQSCVIITIADSSLVETHNIKIIQTRGQEIGDSLIGKINKTFSLQTQPWQVFVRPVPKHLLSATPVAPSQPSANATINAIYVFPYTKTSYLLDTLSSILLPRQIKDSGGFYDATKKMSNYDDSSVTFEILPQGNGTSLYQLQVARHYPITQDVTTIKPLDLFGINQLNRSSYFNVGFFPLNSLLEVTILSRHDISITDHGGTVLPTVLRNGQKVPTDLTKPGWIFDPDSGKQIFAVYLFGTTASATDNDLSLTIGPASGQTPPNNESSTPVPASSTPDYSTYVIIGIVVAGAAAVYLFMKRR
jgi:hypothetical protein